MTTQTDEKQVAEDYIAQFDFTPRLLPGEVIASITSITQASQGLVVGSVALTLSSFAHDGAALAQCKAAVGTHKEKYLLTCLVLTSMNSTLECEQYLLVRNKP